MSTRSLRAFLAESVGLQFWKAEAEAEAESDLDLDERVSG